jgi:hypothetical protein
MTSPGIDALCGPGAGAGRTAAPEALAPKIAALAGPAEPDSDGPPIDDAPSCALVAPGGVTAGIAGVDPNPRSAALSPFAEVSIEGGSNEGSGTGGIGGGIGGIALGGDNAGADASGCAMGGMGGIGGGGGAAATTAVRRPTAFAALTDDVDAAVVETALGVTGGAKGSIEGGAGSCASSMSVEYRLSVVTPSPGSTAALTVRSADGAI